MHRGARSTPHAPPGVRSAPLPRRFSPPAAGAGPAGFRSRPSAHGAFHRWSRPGRDCRDGSPIPSKRARSARASSPVNTTGIRTGFVARATTRRQAKPFSGPGRETRWRSASGSESRLARCPARPDESETPPPRRPHVRRITSPVEQDEPSDPIDVSLLGADAVVQPRDDVAASASSLGSAPGLDPHVFHAVFPSGGAHAPSHNPLCLQGFASSCRRPR